MDEDQTEFGRSDETRPERRFTGYWMPVELIEDERLNWTERALLAEIHALSKRTGICHASNAHLAKHLGISAGSVANMITKLRGFGYVETASFDGRTRTLRSSAYESSLHQPMRSPSAATSWENTEKKYNTKSKDLEQANEIYSFYPRKVAKPAAIKAIIAALKRETFDHLLAKTKRYAEIWRSEVDLQFVPYAQKWFNQQRYNDSEKDWRPREQRRGYAAAPVNVRNVRINKLNQRKAALLHLTRDLTRAECDELERINKELRTL